jgi:hypothetical protein
MFKENTTGTARSRVIGIGPDRRFLPPFKDLFSMPEEVIEDLLSYFADFCELNHLGDKEKYDISNHCPLLSKIPVGFQHLLLTECAHLDPKEEKNYTYWRPDTKDRIFRKWFSQEFPLAFRVRISILKPNTEFSWHIDTNTSVACRCSVALNTSESYFEVKARSQIYSKELQKGVISFTNTGWPHRVYNNSNTPRINVVFGIPFKGLEKYITPSSKTLYQQSIKI